MTIIEKLQLLQKACEICKKTKYVEAIQRYQDYLNHPIMIMIVGQGNQGKTTLLNGLLGRRVAKEGYGVKTVNQNYYRNVIGEECVSTESFEDRQAMKISGEEELLQYYDEFRKDKMQNVYWSLQLQWPKEGIVITDTEGFNQANDNLLLENTSTSLMSGMEIQYSDLFDRIYTEADIIIWCVKGEYCGSTIKKYEEMKVYNKPIFLIYTCADEDMEKDTMEDVITAEDVIEDMRMTLGEIAQDCIMDFAGFAGDKKHPERRILFLENLQREIDHYMEQCENGVKAEVGERLYQGIYGSIYREIKEKVQREYDLFAQYYAGKAALKERMVSILGDYQERIFSILSHINNAIDHTTVYQKIYENSGRSIEKSFSGIMDFYRDIFSKEEKLHEIIDVTLEEKIKLLEKEFILQKEFIFDKETNNYHFECLWDIQENELKKLRIIALGFLFETWKSAEFIKYFGKLKKAWKQTIEEQFKDIQRRYEIGFGTYIMKCYGVSVQGFVEMMFQNEMILQRLEKIEDSNHDIQKQYYIYGLKNQKKIYFLYGEHNQVYRKYELEHKNAFDAEGVLISYYIEPAIDEYTKKLFCNLEQIMREKDTETVYEALQRARVSFPQRFENLEVFQKEDICWEQVENVKRDALQAYYERRLLVFGTYGSEVGQLKEQLKIKMHGEAEEWVQKHLAKQMDECFILWKQLFWSALERYRGEKPIHGALYIDFEKWLFKIDKEIANLYAMNTNADWEMAIKEFVSKEETLHEWKKQIVLAEIRRYIANLQKRVETEKQFQQEKLKEATKNICHQMLNRYLKEAKRVAIIISCLQLVQIDPYEYEESVVEKIKKIQKGVSEDDKKYLVNTYIEAKKQIFGEFVSSDDFRYMESDIRKKFKDEIQKILQYIIQYRE